MSSFPHSGYPIAPPTLRPILSVGLPTSFAPLAGDFPLLADIDERIWDYVDLSVAERLASLVIARAQQMRDAPFWKLTRFPRLKCEVQIDNLAIEAATEICVRRACGKSLVQGTANIFDYQLDRIVSMFGVRPTVDLLAAVRFHTLEVPSVNDGSRLSRSDLQHLIRRPGAWHLYAQCFFPVLTTTWGLSDLLLSVRTYNCLDVLIQQHVIEDLAGLSQLTVGQMMKQPNFGVLSLVDLLEAIDPLVLDATRDQPSASVSGVTLRNRTSETALSVEAAQLNCQPSLFDQHFPDIPPATRIEDMRLDVRTHNCLTILIGQGIISRPSDLSKLSLKSMMQTKNFGRKSLVNLLRAMEQLAGAEAISDSDTPTPPPKQLCVDLTLNAEKLAGSRVAGVLRCNDLRFSQDIRPLVFAANNCDSDVPIDSTITLQRLAQRLAVRTSDPPEPGEVAATIVRIRFRMAQIMKMNLDAELRSLASVHLRGRDLEMCLALWGWTGDVPTTLHLIGDSVGITRERVRQIAAKAERKYGRRTVYLPSLKRVLRYTEQALPAIADDLETDLQARHLTGRRFRVESVMACAKRFGEPVPFAIDEASGVRVVTGATDTGLTRLITGTARRYTSKYGLVNIVDLKEALDNAVRSNIDMSLVDQVIHALDSYQDLGKGWFWLSSARRNHLLTTVVRKILAVAPRIHVSEMRAAIANDPRGMGFSPPTEVVLKFCQNAADCSVDEGFLVANQPSDPAQVLSDVEQLLYAEFRARGPLLRREELEELCADGRMNRNTLEIYLGKSIVARYAPGVYGLRGATFSSDKLRRMRSPRLKSYVDHGWTERAEPWAAIRLSPATLTNGIVSLPTSLRAQVNGAFVLKAEDGTTIGRLVVSAKATWGLIPLFRRRGGEPGDILLLTFDLGRREVTAQMGDSAILPEPSRLTEETAVQTLGGASIEPVSGIC